MHAALLRDLARGREPRRRLVEGPRWAPGGRPPAAGGTVVRPARGCSLRLHAADRLVLSRIRSRLGGRLRHAVSGGAKLPPEVAELFEALGVPILEGYGLTECTAVAAVNRPDRHRVGTVGPPLPGVEVRVAPDGEILGVENVFAGYHLDEAGTREVLDEEGWLRTGDVGFLDQDGFLTITDRKKDIIVTSEGENVSPQRVETALRASPYVSEALVVGHGRPYLVALLSPDAHGIRPAGRTDEDVRRVLGGVVADVNRGAAHAERVRGFAVLPRELRAEEGELTPTLKPRRHVCEAHFRDLIESLYAEARRRPPPEGAGSGASQPL